MRIAFVDFAAWDYDADTPYHRPLGGSQSAVCYLAAELARLDHEVFLFNSTSAKRVVRGVTCFPCAQVTERIWQTLDAVVLLNSVREAGELQARLAPGAVLVLWSQHAHDQPAVRLLHDVRARELFDAFALVSDWQRHAYRRTFGLCEARCRVLRNAAGPAFFDGSIAEWTDAKRPALLAYTSTPFRGLDVLVDVFPDIARMVGGATLKIFSSMQVYQVSAVQDSTQYGELYRKCGSMPGVEYIGSLAQPELAQALREVTMLAYPNHFAETSCISAIEALASGCRIVTSDLGALKETCAGWATLVPWQGDRPSYAAPFLRAVVDVLQADMADPAAAISFRQRQIDFARTYYNWLDRAQEWSGWLEGLRQQKRATHLRPKGFSIARRAHRVD